MSELLANAVIVDSQAIVVRRRLDLVQGKAAMVSVLVTKAPETAQDGYLANKKTVTVTLRVFSWLVPTQPFFGLRRRLHDGNEKLEQNCQIMR